MNDCIVIIPTYNEIENIESITRAVFSLKKTLVKIENIFLRLYN